MKYILTFTLLVYIGMPYIAIVPTTDYNQDTDFKSPSKVDSPSYVNPVCAYEFSHLDRFKLLYTHDSLVNTVYRCSVDYYPQFPIG